MTDGAEATSPADLVFVVGNSRSGTTMLARILGRHPSAFTLGELHYLEQVVEPSGLGSAVSRDRAAALAARLLAVQRSGYLSDHDTTPFEREAARLVADAAPVTAADVFEVVVRHEARQAGRAVPVEQTPRNVYFLPQLLRAHPSARFVVVVRDPRDVLLSQRNRWRRRSFAAEGRSRALAFRYWANYHPIVTSLIWRGGVRAAENALDDPRVLQVRFEDILREPSATIAHICSHLAWTFDPDMLHVPVIGSSLSADAGGRGINRSAAGRWRSALPSGDVYWAEKLCRSDMVRLGYEVTDRASLLAGLWSLACLPLKAALIPVVNVRRSRNLLKSAGRRVGLASNGGGASRKTNAA